MKINYEFIGYTVVYDTIDNEIGFIGYDSRSGGYPYFTATLDKHFVFLTIKEAEGLVNTVKTNMVTYYGAEKVDFSSVRVVKISYEMITMDEKEKQNELSRIAREKLTDEEFEALINRL